MVPHTLVGYVLAAAKATAKAQQTTTQPTLIDQVYAGQVPTKPDYLQHLVQCNELWALLLLAVGIAYLLGGWKLFKVMVCVNAAGLGALLGGKIGSLTDGSSLNMIAAVAGGLLLGVLAMPLLKASVSIMGALAGGVAGYGLWSYISQVVNRPDVVQYSWAGAVIGVVTLGLLGFVIFKAVIMLFTAFQGALLGLSGLLALLLKPYAIPQKIQEPLTNNLHLLPLLVFLLTVLGFVLQYTWSSGKAGGGAKKK